MIQPPSSPDASTGDRQPRHRESGDDRRSAIAAAARSIIAEKGFDRLRTRDIADAVGINIATLHYHVPTKEALIELVTASMRDEFAAHHASMDRNRLTPVDELRLEIREFQVLRRDNPQLLAVMSELGQRARVDDNVARYLVPLRAGWRARISDILSRGIAAGQFRPTLDPDAGAIIVTGAIIALMQYPVDETPDLQPVLEEILRSFLSSSHKETHHAAAD